MSKPALTRYLYLYDEVVLSFLTCLLEKTSINECNFWFSEIYFSGFKDQAWGLLMFIYFDFYFINNIDFISFLDKKYEDFDLKSALIVIKNLYNMKSDSFVFLTRQYNSQIKKINHIFRGKKPTWLLKYPLKYHKFFRYLKNKNFLNAVSCLPEEINDELYECFGMFFEIPNQEIKNIQMVLNKTYYRNDGHKLWALTSLLIFQSDFYKNKKKILYLGNNNKIYDSLVAFNDDKINPVYTTLKHKRLYTIHPLVSCFYLSRDEFLENNDNMNSCFFDDWIYYAFNSPIWENRICSYDILLSDSEKKIEFKHDDELEDFHKHYGYELDEQSKEVQNKHAHVLEKCLWEDWVKKLFVDQKDVDNNWLENIIENKHFHDDFRFLY